MHNDGKQRLIYFYVDCCVYLGICPTHTFLRASLVAQRLKRLPAMWETWVRSLDQEDPLEKEMATHSSILAMDRGAWWAIVHGVAESRTRLSDFTSLHTYIYTHRCI